MNEQNQVNSESDRIFPTSAESKPKTQAQKKQHKYTPKKQSLVISEIVTQRSASIMHLLGYGFLILSLFDFMQIIFPPEFKNPIWEFQAIGQLVERVPIPLLGLLFIFYRNSGELITKKQIYLLRVLSWLSLLIGIFYLLIIPLGIGNTFRINRANNSQINNQIIQQQQQLEQLQSQVENATEAQLQNFLASLNQQGTTPQIDNTKDFKQQLLTQLNNNQTQIKKQGENTRKNQQLNLMKNSVKWNLGALVSSFLFIWLWHLTRWVR
ncbi:MAG: HpsJ family protein, partial [Oscillatoria sp. PMC 1076.18]|nr:HpsJ family protein [Oscillatoria sp. PMC 1076.18]